MAEALAAMLVLSLALGALWSGFVGFSMAGQRVGAVFEQTQAPRRARVLLQNLLGSLDPVVADRRSSLSGDAHQLRFACGAPQDCQAKLSSDGSRLSIFDGARLHTFALPGGGCQFAYLGDDSEPQWPPARESRMRLRGVALRRGGASGSPLFMAKLWREERSDCLFDLVRQDCRS